MRRVAVLVMLGALTAGCGGDGDKPASSTNNPVGTVGGSGASGSGEDDGSGSGTLGILAKQLTKSLSGGESFAIKDGRLTITLGGDPGFASAGSHCQIAIIARDGVGESAPLRLQYPDGTVEDCDDFVAR